MLCFRAFLNFEKFSPVLNFVEVLGEAELYPYSLWFSAGTLTKKQINKRKTSSLLKEKGHMWEKPKPKVTQNGGLEFQFIYYSIFNKEYIFREMTGQRNT